MMKRLVVAVLALAGVAAATSALAQAGKEINFGIIATESTQNLKSF